MPVGAVVVKDGKIIGRGFNKKESKMNAVLHAEIEAISSACKNEKNWRLDGADLYVTMEPCLMCLGAIFNARISRVYFGAKDTSRDPKDFACFIENGYMNHKLAEYVDLDDQECKDLVSSFFKTRRKENKK